MYREKNKNNKNTTTTTQRSSLVDIAIDNACILGFLADFSFYIIFLYFFCPSRNDPSSCADRIFPLFFFIVYNPRKIKDWAAASKEREREKPFEMNNRGWHGLVPRGHTTKTSAFSAHITKEQLSSK